MTNDSNAMPMEPFQGSGYLLDVAGRITARMIMTPREKLVCADITVTTPQALDLMGGTFDQLPVFENERFVGLLYRERLQAATQAALTDAIVPAEQLPQVLADAPIRAAAAVLVREPCVTVFDVDPPGFAGLIHFSDLNRHPLRSNAYLWLSAFEMALAELVRRHVPDPQEWLKTLDEYRQMMILGRWAYDQQQHIELDPVEAAELSDLLRAVRCVPRLLEGLGCTRTQFDKKTGHLVKLRNGVMHPVRSIVRRHEDVQRLADVYTDLRELLDGIYRLLR